MSENNTANLPSDGAGFIRELAARQLLVYLSRKGVRDFNINVDVPIDVIKQCVKNADILYESLSKYHDV